jgi:hypothetical protein
MLFWILLRLPDDSRYEFVAIGPVGSLAYKESMSTARQCSMTDK